MTAEKTTTPLLEVDGLTIRFGGLTAVDDANFTVKEGELLGVIGPNGAGKTTTFNAIAGVVQPTEGQILFRQERIDGRRPDQIARLGVGRTFQKVRLFPSMTVLENVVVAGSTVHRSVKRARQSALETIELIGLGERTHQKVREVPLADRKRTEIARALATDPKMLLLDEMMSGLNPAETDKIVGLVRRLNADGLTVIVIEHVLRVITDLSHRILVFENGRLISEGAPKEVMEDPLVIEAYLGRRHGADR
jgi:branched-chain amino acid transport system ATP-binding protein